MNKQPRQRRPGAGSECFILHLSGLRYSTVGSWFLWSHVVLRLGTISQDRIVWALAATAGDDEDALSLAAWAVRHACCAIAASRASADAASMHSYS